MVALIFLFFFFVSGFEGELSGSPKSLFAAGDTRANQNFFILAMHTLFLREHNRLADQVHAL